LWPEDLPIALIENSIRMNRPIVQSTEPVTLVGGGPVPARDLRAAMARAPVVVAADSGADRLLAAGIQPSAVIGDFDSVSMATRVALPGHLLHRIADQDTTDFDKALRAIAAPLVLAIGFTGARMDHGLAVLNALVRHADRPCIVIGPKDIAFAAPRRLTLQMKVDDVLSLFPLAAVTGTSKGLHWPIDGLAFAPWGMIGTSNRVTRPQVRLTFDGPGMIAILPRARLDAAITTLLARD
jgi:thiamine pyrophosphokinase